MVHEAFWTWLLAQCPCVICTRFVPSGVHPSMHHVAPGSSKRSEFAKVMICSPHHQEAGGFHDAPKAFLRRYRPPCDNELGLLVWQIEDVAKLIRRTLKRLAQRCP